MSSRRRSDILDDSEPGSPTKEVAACKMRNSMHAELQSFVQMLITACFGATSCFGTAFKVEAVSLVFQTGETKTLLIARLSTNSFAMNLSLSN